MRQENHSMKAAYPFYLCLLSLKYSLTSESPTHPFMLCTFEAGTYLIRKKVCFTHSHDLLERVLSQNLCQ